MVFPSRRDYCCFVEGGLRQPNRSYVVTGSAKRARLAGCDEGRLKKKDGVKRLWYGSVDMKGP